jgi:hypothetical protein
MQDGIKSPKFESKLKGEDQKFRTVENVVLMAHYMICGNVLKSILAMIPNMI